VFPINNCLKQVDALSTLLFIFALQYAVSGVHMEQDGLKLNGEHQLLLRTIFGPKRDKLIGKWRKLRNEKLNGLYS